MKKGTIKEMFNTALEENGQSQIKAGKAVAQKLEDLLNEGKVEPKDFSIPQMAAELVPDLYNGNVDPNSAQEVANAVTSSQFPTLSKVVINKEILSAYQNYQEGVDQLVSEAQATRTTEDTLGGFTDVESVEMRPEGMAYEETTFGEKDIKIVMADFGRLISITREAIYNDRTGQLLSNARKIGEKGGQHRAKMIVQTIEVLPRTAFKEAASRAFVYKGSAVTQANFYNATNHTAIDGRTNVNLKTSNGLVDYSDIEGAMLLFDSMKDTAGEDIVIAPNTILVHPSKRVTAWQILNSASYYPVNTNTTVEKFYHVPNPYGPGGLAQFNVMASRYMATTTDWYIGNFKDQLIWLWVYPPSTDSLGASTETAFKTNIIVTYKFSYHGGVGHNDYVNIVRNTA